VERGEGLADRGGCASTGRKVRGVHAVAGKEVHDHGARIADARFAEQLGRAEGQQTAHARRQRRSARTSAASSVPASASAGARTTTRRPSSSSASAAS
jgi:hypothetical protein